MTCIICNSEENFAARCPQGAGGGKGSGLPSATFHAAESRQVAGQLTWPGMNPDEEVDGSLALLIRDLGTMLTTPCWLHMSRLLWRSIPLEAADPWARPAADRQMRRNSSGASSSWGSWIPVQMPTAASLGASTVSTLDTASTVQGTPSQMPSARANTDPAVRQDIQEILRNALEALMEERRRKQEEAISRRHQ